MANEKLSVQTAFAGTALEPTDIMYYCVDNGDGTFSSKKITVAQLLALFPTLYTADGEIDESRIVTIDDATGSLVFSSTDTTTTINPAFIQLKHLDAGSPDDIRTVTLSSANLSLLSNHIQYTMSDVYCDSLSTVSDTPEIIRTCTPTTATNFAITAEVKGYSSSGNTFHYTKITATYRQVAGVATIVGAAEIYNPLAAGMSVDLVPNGSNVDLQVTGLSGNITMWKAITKVF